MRYTRFEFRGHNYMDIEKLLFKFIILIPVIAITAGFIISRFIVAPPIVKQDIEIPQDEYTFEVISPRKYYIVQAGVFTSITNAEQMVNKIRLSNIPAFSWDEGQYNRVIICISNNNDFSVSKVTAVKSAGYDCLIKEFSISPEEISDILKKDRNYALLSQAINKIGESIDNYCDLSKQYEIEQVDYDVLVKSIKALDNEVLKRTSRYKMLKTNDIKQLYQIEQDLQNIDKLLEEYDKINNNPSSLYNRIYLLLNLYKSLVEYYNDSIKSQ